MQNVTLFSSNNQMEKYIWKLTIKSIESINTFFSFQVITYEFIKYFFEILYKGLWLRLYCAFSSIQELFLEEACFEGYYLVEERRIGKILSQEQQQVKKKKDKRSLPQEK